jgi:hypothetical protein
MTDTDEWLQHMTEAEAARWSALRARSSALAAERAAVTNETNRLRQRVMQRALYRKRAAHVRKSTTDFGLKATPHE